MRLIGAIANVISRANDDAAVDERHAAARALLLNGQPGEAVHALESIPNREGDATIWTDLATAHSELATERKDPSLLGIALADVDAALRIDSRLPEALFNRAAILMRLGFREQARRAWEAFIAVDPSSDWANEARQRMRDLGPLQPFKEILARDYERLASDPSAANPFVRSHPQDSRRFGETRILGDWADAEKAGRAADADKHLRVARHLGMALRHFHGEGMVDAAVSAIDVADSRVREHLVEGHILFRDGQKAFMADRAAEAQKTLTHAARELQLGGSPVALLAKYFVAYTYHVQGDIAEGRRRLEALLASAPAGFPAHRGQMLWHMGMSEVAFGEWGAAIETLNEGVAVFDRLGEDDFAASVREIVASIYDRIGNHAAAWHQRMRVLQEIGKRNTPRLQVAVSAITRAAILRRQWRVALSFLAIEIDVASQIDDALLHVETLQLRAHVHGHTGAHAAMAADLALARRVARSLEDKEIRRQTEIDMITVEGMFAASPADSIRLLTVALDDYRGRGRRMRLPDLYLHRGRALAATGEPQGAADDYEAGIVELESNRESLQTGEDRWGVFDAERELFDEAILLALAHKDHQRAFGYSERARARELLDSLGGTRPAIQRLPIPAGTVVVEYASLADRLLFFVIDREGVHAIETTIARETLAAEAARFVSAVREGTPAFLPLSRALHRRLIEPVARRFGGNTTVVFVPCPELASLPFAALRNEDGRYLVEERTVVVAPSVSVYSAIESRRTMDRHDSHVLVIGNPIAENGQDPLPGSEREARAVAAQYRNATPLIRDQATPEAFRRHATAADAIHIAGHAVESAGPAGTAALLLTGGRLDAKTIAALNLRNVETVVLSACSTARGDVRAMEGVISVARAFLAAGASSVIGTLWPIDDEHASRFFPRLHEHMAAGASAAEALRMTQIEWISRPDSSPAIWAAVQNIGR